jgi:uncharacterized protein YndB with AHSA1/START domain
MNLTINRSVTHNTFVIERSYPASPEKVFDAFSDPAKKRRWFIEGDHHEVTDFSMDFRVGGTERAKYRFGAGTPLQGQELSNDTVYQDIVPNRRIVFSAAMSLGDRHISVTLATIEFFPSGKGTELIFTHQAGFFEGSDGPEMREGGWRKLFDRLAKELER